MYVGFYVVRNERIFDSVVCRDLDAAVAAGDKAAAEAALPVAIAEISKAASKGIFHKNTAARKVSRITKAVNTLA